MQREQVVRHVYPGGHASSPHSLQLSPPRKRRRAFFFGFLMPEPAVADFFFWLVAGSRIMETSLGLLPVTGVPSAVQRCLSCDTDSFISDSSVSLGCGVMSCGVTGCGVMRNDMFLTEEEWSVSEGAEACHTQSRCAHERCGARCAQCSSGRRVEGWIACDGRGNRKVEVRGGGGIRSRHKCCYSIFDKLLSSKL